MDYDAKATLTTVLGTYLVPSLVAAGISVKTADALVGLIVAAVIIGFNMLGEMWNSKHLSRDREEDSCSDCVCTFDDSDRVVDDESNGPVYDSGDDVDLPEFDDGDFVSMDSLTA